MTTLHHEQTDLQPEFSSGSVARAVDAMCRRIELFLSADRLDLVGRESVRLGQAIAYLKANFPPAALARGPIPQ